jgi:hypothetical protein
MSTWWEKRTLPTYLPSPRLFAITICQEEFHSLRGMLCAIDLPEGFLYIFGRCNEEMGETG